MHGWIFRIAHTESHPAPWGTNSEEVYHSVTQKHMSRKVTRANGEAEYSSVTQNTGLTVTWRSLAIP